MHPDADRVDAVTAELRARGFMLRMTEWTEGFQCGAVLRGDTRIAFFSGWKASEVEAWEETLALAAAWEGARAPEGTPGPS